MLVDTLFNEAIEGLHDDGFEGSINESRIFKEVFFRGDQNAASKRSLATGVIDFQFDCSKHAGTSFFSNSKNTAITSQLDSYNVTEDTGENSAPGCFSEGRALLTEGDYDFDGKRMKLSVDGLSYSRPYSGAVLHSSAPSKGFVSGMYQPASQSVCRRVTCRLVESSSQGVASSCYVLKQHAEICSRGETSAMDVSTSRLQSLDGSDEKEVNASKAITSPISLESSATKVLISCPSVTDAKKSRSHQGAEKRMKPPNSHELSVAKISLNEDSVKDPRPLLRFHTQNLLRAAGWEIGRRKREDNIRGEYLYFSPQGGRPIRGFRRVWNLCGQSLIADGSIVVQEDSKQWTDMTHFWYDLSSTFIEIEDELNNTQTTASLAYQWYLLDPFANMVFIDKKLGILRAGEVVKARRSFVIDTSAKDNTFQTLKNVHTIGNLSGRHSTGPFCGSSVVRGSASTASEGTYHDCNEKCDRGSSYFRQLERGAVKASKGVSVYMSKDKFTHSTNTVSGRGTRSDFSGSQTSKQDMISLKACGSEVTSDHSDSCLFEVPITSGNCIIMLGGSDSVCSHHGCNTNNPSFNKYRFDHCGEMALEIKECVSMGSSEGKTFSGKVTEKAENQLEGFLDDHLNCISDSETQFNDQYRSYRPLHTCVNILSKPCRQSIVENSCLIDAEVMQHPGHIERDCEQCNGASKSKINGATYVADALLRKKEPKKSKRTSEVKLTRLFQNDRLDPAASYMTERHDINANSVWLESVHVEECLGAINGRTDTSSSQHQNGKKLSRFRKFHKNSGSPKKSNQFSYEDLTFENISDEAPLRIQNESRHHVAWRQELKSEKHEIQNGSGQKRSITCRLKDDDLLISAIMKNKTSGSTRKESTQKMKSFKSVLRKRKSQKGSCRLLPRRLAKGGKHIEGKWSIFGVRTVLSWLIDAGVISLNEVIQYRNPKNDAVVKDGLVTRDGILCTCCNNVLSVSEFKLHAGFKMKRPCLDLFMESGKPFTLCQLEAWSSEYKARKSATRTDQVEATDHNDDRCGLCGDGGELICCDSCPSTFHQACLYVKELPEGSWYCPYCTCQICGGGVLDDEEPLKSPNALKCSQCEHKYHEACLKQKGTCRGVASDTWFCSESCQEVYLGLQSRIGFVNIHSDGFSSMLLRCIHGDQRVHSAQRFVALKAECNSKLAVALTIMEECFISMVDPRTGIDMIPHIVYNWGSQFARLNYNGFYTVLLEKDDVLMSVASIRIHGVTVAEMPLIATCSKYRRQGMCRRLMNSVEEMLRAFKVEKLVISALPSLVETWTGRFGFEPMEDDERMNLSHINLMVFPETVWLKKPIYGNQATTQQGGCGRI
ncbi:increased DNA methylation 1-like isoform X1 [Actinidia eriantha]|uniref:increased DNA methylation 1-like isoform X1 n=1 Tax=Actinidia eriantha TaxID=165200 RepID=UPI00258D4189|nr:increased DNA methylation 1-like isoform X1 [Actinidia eriantha]XP_057465607.1 increased DNA methylation 1-like isoform X1 [Actinidia eriantha]